MLTGIPERALDGSEGEEGLGMSVAWALPVEFRAVRVPTRKEDSFRDRTAWPARVELTRL